MDRREFLSWTGAGWLAASLPVAIAACSPTNTTSTPDGESAATTPSSAPSTSEAPTEMAAATDDFVDIGQSLESLADSSSSVGVTEGVPEKVIVIRDPADSNALLALTSNCNHRDCTVDWNADNQEFVCPCHQSRFGLDGSILAGPATEPLRVLEARVVADSAGTEMIEVKF
ncbi:MAG: ubiquinol-cytochrome c reductase iron-sulfur subunit [Leptolyngbyaceae bacterium]|nr:ubiquinol-cytochrome c reductase iron-sulfur subunit [Leptolyngbyaceae bacterium]